VLETGTAPRPLVWRVRRVDAEEAPTPRPPPPCAGEGEPRRHRGVEEGGGVNVSFRGLRAVVNEF